MFDVRIMLARVANGRNFDMIVNQVGTNINRREEAGIERKALNVFHNKFKNIC